jgi:predicted RNA polymerase sigma factor
VDETRRTVEAVARDSYGRLISYLSARSGDVSGAEDALADAFLSALRAWPESGVPEKPEAWLLAAARNRLIDRVRHERVRDRTGLALTHALEEAEQLACGDHFPDERLKLMFVCAHPALDTTLHTPLMLQGVLGLDATAIAAAFLVPASTMGQRLSRAKAKIREAGITFSVPESEALAPRLNAVLNAIYAAYGSSSSAEHAGSDARREQLADEALWLGRVLVRFLPDEPEVEGLCALLSYCEARKPAQRSEQGVYVPLAEQDVRRWNREALREGDLLLARAATKRRMGRFQLEAAIQSAHMERARSGVVDASAIALLYAGLLREAPTLGAWVGQAAALAESEGAAAGIALLGTLDRARAEQYQPYWAVRAHLLAQLGHAAQAQAAYGRALTLTRDETVCAFLRERCARLGHG